MVDILQTTYSHAFSWMIPTHFLEWFPCIFLNDNLIKISFKLVPKDPFDNSSIGSGNGFALNKRQAITWTNGECHLASPGHNELTLQ